MGSIYTPQRSAAAPSCAHYARDYQDGSNLLYCLKMSDTGFTVPRLPARPPNCLKCVHFKITWDVDFPRSCELFAIKCRGLPSQEVFRATGANCPSFGLKEGLR